MKKVMKIALAVALVMSTSTLFAQKFGRINSAEIISSMPEAKEMQTNLEAFEKTLQEGIEAIQVEYTTKMQELQKAYETLPEATREMKLRELQDLEGRIGQYRQAAQQDLQRKYQELLTPIQEKAKSAIDQATKEGGFLAVFDMASGAIIAFDEANLADISSAVKAILGITAETAAPAPAK